MTRTPKTNAADALTVPNTRRPATGIGQLSLVEHALCPLDAARSPRGGRVFVTGHYYADRNRHRRKATVRVTCPGGLFPADEFYLWGLLALTVAAAPRGGRPGPRVPRHPARLPVAAGADRPARQPRRPAVPAVRRRPRPAGPGELRQRRLLRPGAG